MVQATQPPSVLVLGASGQLGHRVCLELAGSVDVVAVGRRPIPLAALVRLAWSAGHLRTWSGVDATQIPDLAPWLQRIGPSLVVNGIGIVKQSSEAYDSVSVITVNSLFPHRLARACHERGIRLLQLSTDCVFSGNRGNYREDDIPDPADLYGRSKLLGEPGGERVLTIRTSMVGWELSTRHGLLEWFAGQRGRRIRGYRRAVFSGLGTPALAKLIAWLARECPATDGLYHVAAEPISKYDLLVGLRDRLGWKDIEIEPDEDFRCDRSLDGSRFRQVTGWSPPTWSEMLDALAAEWPVYEALRKTE